VDLRRLRSAVAMFGVGVTLLLTPHGASGANAAQGWRFHLEEATIADVQRAIRAKQITAAQLVNLYFKRIEAYKDLGR
jgi:amidase